MSDLQDADLERALALTSVDVPDEIDRRMVAAAGQTVRRRATIRRVQTAAGAVALAAAAALAFFLTNPPATAARDVNRDGRFDVLDAQRLARGVAAGDVQPTWDLDGDGRVDARDAEFAARAAVSLGKGAGG